MADRYVYSIHSNTKWGMDIGVSFFTCWCGSEADAIALLAVVNSYLPNYAKCSLSKVLVEASNYEIPNSGAVITDVSVVSFQLCNSQNKNIRRTIKIPLGFRTIDSNTYEVNGVGELGTALTSYVTDQAGNPLDIVIGTADAYKNVIQGNAVEAPEHEDDTNPQG